MSIMCCPIDWSISTFIWVLVFSGHLLLVVKSLRDAHRFGFESLEKITEEGENLVQKGIDLARLFPEVGRL